MNASCMCPHQPPRAAYLRGLHWAAAFGLGLAVIGAAHAAADDAVVGATDVSRRVEIAGHRAAWATTANDRGPVPADFVLDHLTVQLKRTAQRQQAFDAFLRAQQDPYRPATATVTACADGQSLITLRFVARGSADVSYP